MQAKNTFTDTYEWLNWLTSCVECYTWLLDNELIESAVVASDGNLSTAVDYFVDKMIDRSVASDEDALATFGGAGLVEILTPRQSAEMNEMSCTLLVRLFELVETLLRCPLYYVLPIDIVIYT